MKKDELPPTKLFRVLSALLNAVKKDVGIAAAVQFLSELGYKITKEKKR